MKNATNKQLYSLVELSDDSSNNNYLISYLSNNILRSLSYGGYFKAKEMQMVDRINELYRIEKNGLTIFSDTEVSYGIKEDKMLCLITSKIQEKYHPTQLKQKDLSYIKEYTIEISRFEYMSIMYHQQYSFEKVKNIKKYGNIEDKRKLTDKKRNVKKDMDSAFINLKNIKSISDGIDTISFIDSYSFSKDTYRILINPSFLDMLSDSKKSSVAMKNISIFTLNRDEYVLASKIYHLFFIKNNIVKKIVNAKKQGVKLDGSEVEILNNTVNTHTLSSQSLASYLGLNIHGLSNSLIEIKVINRITNALENLMAKGYFDYEDVAPMHYGVEEVIESDSYYENRLCDPDCFRRLNVGFTLLKNTNEYFKLVEEHMKEVLEKEEINKQKKKAYALQKARKKAELDAEKACDKK